MPGDTSPTPSERERLDAEARQKEQEEQSKLPYKWTQTISDLDITLPLPVDMKAKQLDVKIAKNHLYVSVKNEPAIIDVRDPSFPPLSKIQNTQVARRMGGKRSR